MFVREFLEEIERALGDERILIVRERGELGDARRIVAYDRQRARRLRNRSTVAAGKQGV